MTKEAPGRPSGARPPDVDAGASFASMARSACVPLLLACAFGVRALAGASGAGVVSSDAARHAMNGALIHDWLRAGGWQHPVIYAERYYSHWPSISLPYHPPLFPLIESLSFFALGVNIFAARLVVAISTVVCALALYRLVLITHRLPSVALAAVAVFLATPLSQHLSQDVMLEFPTLVFALGALLCLAAGDPPSPLRRGIAFALLAGAAVWTKQQAVFLGLVPFLCLGFSRRRPWLRGRALWVSLAVFVILVLTLDALSLPLASGWLARVTAPGHFGPTLADNVRFYAAAVPRTMGAGWLGLLSAAAVCWLLVGSRARSAGSNTVYWAWAVAVVVTILLGSYAAERYLFFLLPPLLVLALVGLHRAVQRFGPPGWAWLAPTVVAGAYCALHLGAGPRTLGGPSNVADFLAADEVTRVVYCGESNGQFIFALRSRIDGGETVVIRGDKLSAEAFEAGRFEAFARAYGISHVVVERGPSEQNWDSLSKAPAASMRLERRVPLAGAMSGVLEVYRFKDPSPVPQNTLVVRTWKSDKQGADMTLDFTRLR